jgi:indolepyruvate ferredoxin oxidoreductase beta subunit
MSGEAGRDGVKSVLMVGVGGQGTILAGRILSEGLAFAGYDVKMSEIHGMSQRGGSVSTHVRFGAKVSSPVTGRGEADVIVAFEKLEALRWLEYLKEGGLMLINDFEIAPAPVLMGIVPYPSGIIEELSGKARVCAFDARKIAEGLGNAKAMNIVLLGALAKAVGASGVDWEGAIRRNVKKGFEELNIKAFEQGFRHLDALA